MTRHPAKFSDPLIPIFQRLLPPSEYPLVLDPFAGTGKIHQLKQDTVGIEIEPEWASLHPNTVPGDALHLPFDEETFDAVCTSPTYGNRMADHHEAQDKCKACGGLGHEKNARGIPKFSKCPKCGGTGLSRRNTYRHALGRALTENNSGGMQWGDEYREFHKKAWAEVYRVLKPGGRFVLNIKDHIRKGERQEVSLWHLETVIAMPAFSLRSIREVPLKGNGFGQNGAVRVDHENVFVFQKS